VGVEHSRRSLRVGVHAYTPYHLQIQMGSSLDRLRAYIHLLIKRRERERRWATSRIREEESSKEDGGGRIRSEWDALWIRGEVGKSIIEHRQLLPRSLDLAGSWRVFDGSLAGSAALGGRVHKTVGDHPTYRGNRSNRSGSVAKSSVAALQPNLAHLS
jgi:hypothetical protein